MATISYVLFRWEYHDCPEAALGTVVQSRMCRICIPFPQGRGIVLPFGTAMREGYVPLHPYPFAACACAGNAFASAGAMTFSSSVAMSSS